MKECGEMVTIKESIVIGYERLYISISIVGTVNGFICKRISDESSAP